MNTFFSRHRKLFTISALVALAVCLCLVWVPIFKSLFSSAPIVAPNPDLPIIPIEKPKPLSQYIEIIDSCGPYFGGTCVNVRSGPGTEYPKVAELRTGMVLKIEKGVVLKGMKWYKVALDKTILYPERIVGDWYVSADFARLITNEGDVYAKSMSTTTPKRILVDRSEQMLYAYDGKELFMKESISTGLELTPTPRGTFFIFKKTPSRYMQGPLPGVSDQYYDLPGVPWNLYFTEQGAVIHGAYWHDKFGQHWSHGCVNLPPDKAEQLYEWADAGTPVTVRD